MIVGLAITGSGKSDVILVEVFEPVSPSLNSNGRPQRHADHSHGGHQPSEGESGAGQSRRHLTPAPAGRARPGARGSGQRAHTWPALSDATALGPARPGWAGPP